MAKLLRNAALNIKLEIKQTAELTRQLFSSPLLSTLWTVAHIQLHTTRVLLVISPVIPLSPHPSRSLEAPTSAASIQAEEKV